MIVLAGDQSGRTCSGLRPVGRALQAAPLYPADLLPGEQGPMRLSRCPARRACPARKPRRARRALSRKARVWANAVISMTVAAGARRRTAASSERSPQSGSRKIQQARRPAAARRRAAPVPSIRRRRPHRSRNPPPERFGDRPANERLVVDDQEPQCVISPQACGIPAAAGNTVGGDRNCYGRFG